MPITRRLIPLAAAGALGLSVVLVPPATADDLGGSSGAPPATTLATHTIADVQGTGDATPLDGTTVTVDGVVTADYRTGGYNGIVIQAEGSGGVADTTPGASDGIFVFLGNRAATTEVTLGDLVQVTGVAGEYFGLTQINASAASAAVEVLGVPNTPPTPVELPDTLLGGDREQLESMLVDPTGDYLVASSHELDRFGSVWLSAGPALPVTSTAVERPGPAADAIAADNAARRIVLDDGKNAQLQGALANTQPYFTADDPVRTGDAVDVGDLPYVLHYGFDLWRLQPVTPIDAATPADAKASFVERNPRPVAPAEVGGDVVVGAFNVLNYFTTLTSQDPDARGAATPEQLAAQRAKIVAAILALGADVVALQEIENSVHFGDGTPDVALADLVAGLDDLDGAGTWAYVPTPAVLVGPSAPATDVIMSAIIYRPAAVTPVGEAVTDVDESVWDIAREPVAQLFTTSAGEGSEFWVVANHFKSKSGGTGAEPADGQGFFNAERVEQAGAVIDLVTSVQESSGVQDVVVLGDLNSYAKEDPIAAFADAGYVDLVATTAPGQHTYTFDGELGSLDHALATPSFAQRVTGTGVWDINADEWFGYQYTGAAATAEAGTVYRSSDHDPITVGLSTAPQPVVIDLLGINDFHGRLEAGGGTNTANIAGAAVLAGAVDSFRSANPNTLFVSAGDNIGASTFTSFIQQDTPTIEALNAMGLDVTALGNHEFDQGRVDLDDRVVPASEFPYLGANVYDRATGEPAFDESFVTEVDGVRVGFIGAVTEELPSLVTPTGIASLEVRPVVDEVNRVAEALSDGDETNGEADVLVLLVHEGPATGDLADSTGDTVFGRIVAGVSPEIDTIFSGHTHQRFAHQVPVDGWPDGLTRPVVQSGQYSENLARVTLTVDPTTGDVVASSSQIVPLTADGAPAFPADPEVAQIVADAVAVADELGAVSLGQITGDLRRAVQSDGTTENRGGESTLGNLVADVQLWATQELGTQIAFMNPGGLRADLRYASSGPADPDGNVTYREAATVQPFANTLVTTTLTGQQVIGVLEEQWQPETASRPFLKLGVAGLTYTYDPTAPAGSRVTQVLVGGAPLDPTAQYRVVVNSFLASGGDNFLTLAQGTGAADSGRVDLQAFVDYLAEHTPLSPDLAQRAVGVRLADPPVGGYAPGEQVTVDLSSLLFSVGEAEGAEVTLAADGSTLGTFPIDPSVVDTTDEVGRATATFAVPQGAVGDSLEVAVTVAGTGTTTAFTVPLAQAPEPVPVCTVGYDAAGLLGVFAGAVTIRNDSATTVQGWQLTWRYTRGEKAVTGVGARIAQSGASVTASSTVLNHRIRPGQTVAFAVLGRAPRGPGSPTDLTLNGAPCAVE